MPSLYIYVGAVLYLFFAAWCIGAPRNPAEKSE
jgi:hypothetical protein